jgi:hypothetical protein
MPLPSPKGNQEKQSFVAQCMSDEAVKKEFPNQKQRAAVCYSQYKQAKKIKGCENLDWDNFSGDGYIILL